MKTPNPPISNPLTQNLSFKYCLVALLLMLFSCSHEDTAVLNPTAAITNKLKKELKLDQFKNQNFAKNLIVNWESIKKTEKDGFEIYEVEIKEKNPTLIKSNLFQSELKYVLISIKKENHIYSYLIEIYSGLKHPLYDNSIQKIDGFTGTLNAYELSGKQIDQLVVNKGKSLNPSKNNALRSLNEVINRFHIENTMAARVPVCYLTEHVYVTYSTYTDHYYYITAATGTTYKTYSYTTITSYTVDEPMTVPCGQSESSYETYKYVTIRSEIIENVSTAIEYNIDDTLLDPCLKGIMAQLKKATNNDIAKILIKLGANNMYTVSMVMKPAGTYAETQKISAYNYEIRVDRSRNTNATTLFKATALVHEVIHSYFLSLVDDYKYTPSTGLPSFPELFEAYVKKEYPTSSDKQDAQHLAMANRYVDAMAAALQEYDANYTIPYQVYQDLAWGTLSKAPIFEKTFPSGSANNIRITNRYGAESSGRVVGQGTPNQQTPVGKPCK